MMRMDRDGALAAGVRATDGLVQNRPWLDVGQGQFAVDDDPGLKMTATLGSCVAVVFHDPVRRSGGMTHIFQCVDPGPMGGANVIAEIEKLINAFMRRGSNRSDLTAQLVGGARTLTRGRDVGGEIGTVCVDFLVGERLRIGWMDLGGTRPRRIMLEPATGHLHVSYPGTKISQQTPARRMPGDTELF